MKRFSMCFFIILILGTLFSGCSDDSNEKLNEEFNEHLKSYYKLSEDGRIFSSKKLTFGKSSLEIEEVEYGTRHIIAQMGDMINANDEVWKISGKELKQEMRDFAEAFISFAKEKDMDNDYYLYVEIYSDSWISFVYDYEQDILYIPKKYDLYREMYSTFGTTRQSKISETEKGKQWLVENGFGEIKHHEYEAFHEYSPGVFINDDGHFDSYFLDWTLKE